ncbi:MAG TPA: hypothetical protein VFE47_15000, partial [Tepidisphaeraceae bacterium]|nr:hypothetical protein [Tepidisphaeraceae bacterium]
MRGYSNILAQVYWHAPQFWPIAVVAAVILLGAVVILYPAQLRLVPWPWRMVLPALRVTAVLALVAALLKPVILRQASAEERGAVLILVDRSRSMGIVDNARTSAQLVALADALGKLPPKVRSDAPTALAADLERLRTSAANVRGAQEDLDYARVSGRDIEVRQKRLKALADVYAQSASGLAEKAAALPRAEELAKRLSDLAHVPDTASRDAWRGKVPEQIAAAVAAVATFGDNADSELYESNADVRSACDAIAANTRFSLVEQALLRPGGVVASAGKDAEVRGYSLAGDVTPLELMHGNQVASSLNTTPDGDESKLTEGIVRAIGGMPVRAVVLFSDGRQVGGDPTIVSGLTPLGVPVFTVSAAAAEPPRDVSFASVSVPSSVFAGQSIRVKAELRHNGFDDVPLQLHCTVGNEQQVRTITLRDNKPATAEFTFRMSAEGEQKVHLEFPALTIDAKDPRKSEDPAKVAHKSEDPRKAEASTDNNEVDRWVKVVHDPMKVLLVAGAPTWDYQYLKKTLARLSGLSELKLTDIVLDPANPHLYLSTKDIRGQDVVVLFDVPVAACDAARWGAIEHVAHVTGGSVIIVAGDAPLPIQENSGNILARELLPFKPTFKPVWKTWPGNEPSFHFVPTADAESMELFKLPSEGRGNEPDAAARRWEQLPGCFRFLQLPEVHDANFKTEARALMVEEESRLPVLTEMRLDGWAGRAFFLGLDETWRWRFKAGERDQEHFWRQLIQHASENPYFKHDGPLALDADKVSAAPGEIINVRARINEEIPPP